MNINMNDSRIITVTQLRKFLKGTEQYDLSLRDASIEEKYRFIADTVKRLEYHSLRRKDKKVVRRYMKKVTGYKHTQLNRLIKRARKGELMRKQYSRTHVHRIYESFDIKLLEKTDEYHLLLSEKATQEILRREYERSIRETSITLTQLMK